MATTTYLFSCPNADVYVECANDQAAIDMAADGYEPEHKTYYVSMRITRADAGEDDEPVLDGLVAVEPLVPPCADSGEHEWYEGRAWGNGGGVIVPEYCGRCGCRRVIDTWDQSTPNGEPMETVEYHRDDTEAQQWAQTQIEDALALAETAEEAAAELPWTPTAEQIEVIVDTIRNRLE